MKNTVLKLAILVFMVVYFSSCEKTIVYNVEDIPDFAALPAPPSGQGYQLHIPAFPVPSNFEREVFLRLAIGNSEDIYVSRYEVICRPNTHHFIAYGYQNESADYHPDIGVLRDQNLPDGRANLGLTMGSGALYCGVQEPEYDLQFPEGMAVKIPANSTIDMNSHYFNYTDDIIFGEVYLNLWTIPKEDVKEVLEYDDIDNEDVLFLPKNQNTTITYTETFNRPTQIRQMFAHMHKRGYLFDVYKVGGADDGELLYQSLDYRHPPNTFFDPPLLVRAGEGLQTQISYNNESDRDINFGVTSEDEMGILFYSKITNE